MAQTVLVADNHIASQRFFEMVLTREGYEVIIVGSGTDALEHIKQKRPDIALIDAIMPEVDGYEVCQMVKSDPNFKETPVILLAGTYEDFDQEKGESAGPDAILDKPSESNVIISTVKEILASQAQQQAEVETAPPSVEEVAEIQPGAEVIQEPAFVEEEYAFDEDSEEADLAVETEILDEEAEYEEFEEEEEMPPAEEHEAPTADEEEFPIEEEVEEVVEEEHVAIEEEVVSPVSEEVTATSVVSAPSPEQAGQLSFSDEHLDIIVNEVAKRLAGKLVPVLMKELANYLLQQSQNPPK